MQFLGPKELLQLLGANPNKADHERAMEVVDVISWLRQIHAQFSASHPVSAIAGHVYRTYCGSVVAIVALEECGCFRCVALSSEHPDFKVGEFWRVHGTGVINSYRLDWLNQSLAEDLGPADQLGRKEAAVG